MRDPSKVGNAPLYKTRMKEDNKIKMGHCVWPGRASERARTRGTGRIKKPKQNKYSVIAPVVTKGIAQSFNARDTAVAKTTSLFRRRGNKILNKKRDDKVITTRKKNSHFLVDSDSSNERKRCICCCFFSIPLFRFWLSAASLSRH